MNEIPLLLFGFFLGIKHAFEADHMIAVSTMVAEHKKASRAAAIGAFWGIGHTTSLFVIGLIVLLFKITIPVRLGLTLEISVGLMLILLGARTLLQKRAPVLDTKHSHERAAHRHIHEAKIQGFHRHKKSFLVGSVHGLAGSGALVILVLSATTSLLTGIYYILLFGIGSIVGMSLMSLFVGIPFIFSAEKLPVFEKYLRIVAGILSIAFGLYIVYQIAFVEGLVTYAR